MHQQQVNFLEIRVISSLRSAPTSNQPPEYALETYYFPQSWQQEINQAVNEVQRRQQKSLRMKIKIDEQIGGVPVSLWVSYASGGTRRATIATSNFRHKNQNKSMKVDLY